MDMRKLIDETQFQNINELSKRWKKQSNQTSFADSRCSVSSNLPEKVSNTQEKSSKIIESNIQISHEDRPDSNIDQHRKKREVIPQVIDEDTEHFRNRLEHLLNTFKTDAVSEFMTMKKSMLDYQKDCVKNDTQKYLNMYEQKNKELLHAKDQLITLTSDVEKKAIQIELMSNHIAKINQTIKITKYLSRPFSILIQNKLNQQALKFKMKEASKFDNRRMKIKAFNGMRNIVRELKNQKNQIEMNNKIEMEVSDIVGRFQKQIEILKQKLNEATLKNEQYENSKHMIQDNLKKAFLRGISSMNMEAMGIFGSNIDPEFKRSQNVQYMNSSYMEQNMGISRTVNKDPMNHTTINALNSQSNSSAIINRQKIQSKDHKWKQAPILGVEERQEIEQPRPILVKPTTTEGKVIKIIDGKSAVEVGGKKTVNNLVTSQKTQAGSKKRI